MQYFQIVNGGDPKKPQVVTILGGPQLVVLSRAILS